MRKQAKWRTELVSFERLRQSFGNRWRRRDGTIREESHGALRDGMGGFLKRRLERRGKKGEEEEMKLKVEKAEEIEGCDHITCFFLSLSSYLSIFCHSLYVISSSFCGTDVFDTVCVTR